MVTHSPLEQASVIIINVAKASLTKLQSISVNSMGKGKLATCYPFDDNASIRSVIGCFLGNLYIMDVRFAHACGGDFNEHRFFVHISNASAT